MLLLSAPGPGLDNLTVDGVGPLPAAAWPLHAFKRSSLRPGNPQAACSCPSASTVAPCGHLRSIGWDAQLREAGRRLSHPAHSDSLVQRSWRRPRGSGCTIGISMNRRSLIRRRINGKCMGREPISADGRQAVPDPGVNRVMRITDGLSQ